MEEKSLEEKAGSAQVRKLFFFLTTSAGGGYMILCKPQVQDTVHMGTSLLFLSGRIGQVAAWK